MPDSVTFDVSQLADLAEDLAGAGRRLSSKVPAIIKRGAQNIKTDAQRRFRSQVKEVYLPHFARAITYDVKGDARHYEAEIGPETGKLQGGMGPGVEFGSARHAPIPNLYPAFDEEVPKTEAALADATAQAVLKR